MKAKLFSVVLLICVLAQTSIAQRNDEPKFQKKKSYSKSYSVSSSDRIRLNNQFGEMKLVHWDKNEVKVDVSITAGSSEDDARAQQILDRISIEDGKSSDGVYFKTKMSDDRDNDRDRNNNGKNRSENMEINYTVYLPTGNPLTAENQFGDMIVPDYKGEATISSKFGSLTTGNISNAKSVNVEFGRANIGSIDAGNLTIKFSTGSVDNLSGNVVANFEFCDKIKVNINNDIKDLNLKSSYSTVYLDVNKNLSASYDVSTSFGEFSNNSSFTMKKLGDDDRSYYSSGYKYAGTSGSGTAKMRLRTDFGKIIIGHDLKVDMSSKKNKD